MTEADTLPPTTRHLDDLAAYLGGRQKVTIGEILVHLGPSSFGLVMIFLALLALVPVPGLFGFVFGLALVLVALQMALGRSQPWLPSRVLALSLPAGPLATGIGKLLPWIARLENLHAPGRWSWLTGDLFARIAGLAIVALGVAITLPIPLANLPPSAATVMISFAMLVGDGLALLIGFAAGALALVWAGSLMWFGADALAALVSMV